MNNKCICESKTTGRCCPADGGLKNEWLLNLEKEHESLRPVSEEIAGKLKIISNPDRVEILLMLEKREHCVEEMARKLKVPKPALSYHLGILKKYGMVCVKKRSRFAFYSLSRIGKNTITVFRNI